MNPRKLQQGILELLMLYLMRIETIMFQIWASAVQVLQGLRFRVQRLGFVGLSIWGFWRSGVFRDPWKEPWAMPPAMRASFSSPSNVLSLQLRGAEDFSRGVPNRLKFRKVWQGLHYSNSSSLGCRLPTRFYTWFRALQSFSTDSAPNVMSL